MDWSDNYIVYYCNFYNIYNTIQYNLFPANGSHTRWRYKKNTAIQTYNINKKKKQIIKGSLQTQTVFKIQLLEHTNTYIHSYTYKHTHKYIRIYTQIYCLYHLLIVGILCPSSLDRRYDR